MAALELNDLDESIRGLAARNESAFIRQAILVTHTEAARRLGIQKSTQSDWCKDNLRRCMQVLAAYNLQVIDRNAKAMPPDQLRAYMTLASAHMEQTLLAEQGVTQPGELGD